MEEIEKIKNTNPKRNDSDTNQLSHNATFVKILKKLIVKKINAAPSKAFENCIFLFTLHDNFANENANRSGAIEK